MTDRRFFPAIFIGLITVLIIVLLSSLIISLLLSFTSFTDHSASWLIMIIAFIAMFLGGAISGVKAKEKGWIAGACTALLFSLITFLIQSLGYDNSFTSEQYLFHGGYMLVATLGGVIGVNFSRNND